MQYEKDTPYLRECVSKHSQLMNMYFSYGSFEKAKEEFNILRPIFESLKNEGETMYFYTLEDFNRDSERFRK